MSAQTRKWLNPVLTLSGGISLASGIILFFLGRIPPVMGAHRWLSLVFALTLFVHTWLNRKALIASLGGKRRALLYLALGCVLLAALTLMAARIPPLPG